MKLTLVVPLASRITFLLYEDGLVSDGTSSSTAIKKKKLKRIGYIEKPIRLEMKLGN
jgi:hypothetical protein